MTGGTIIAVPQAAFAAEPFSETQMLATQSNSSEIVALDRATGATTKILTVPGGVEGLNQIGITGDGNTLMLTNPTTVFEYTASSETWETTARVGTTVASTMGGVDPATGLFYYGGQATGSTFTFRSYSPTTNALSSSVLSVTAADAPGGNGDLSFDSRGNLYFVSSNDQTAQLYRVDANQLGGSATVAATKVGPVIDSRLALNSMAFADDGFIYIAGRGADGFLRANPVTGAILERRTLSVAITDLGTNAVPFTAAVTTELPGGRVEEGDQFTVTIGGGGITTGNTGTTTGTETSETVGPILILPGETYTVEQTPAGTTNPDAYNTVWTCVDPATGTQVTGGTGTSGQFTVPAGVKDVACTFTSTPKPAPVANDDVSTGNELGKPVTVEVIDNDSGDLDPTTVQIIDGKGDPVTKLVVPGEGTWTVDPATGAVTFAPENGFSGNPTPITYVISDARGKTAIADVTITFVPEAADDESLNNAQGRSVLVDVVGNDRGDLDPTTVRIIDGKGDPVTKLVVPGEGTWTVDPATGAITFAPEAGFSGNPTSISYAIADTLGTVTAADVVVTYVPGAINDTSLNNPQGDPVTVNVIGNDRGDLDPTTVRIIDGKGDPVSKLVVTGEGIWTVAPATGAITFTPQAGFAGNPTPITYEVSDTAGNTTTANVTITFVPESANDKSVGNPQGAPVTVDVIGNDSGDLDPATVRIIDGRGDPVTKLVVTGEGTWTVNPATGAITFTPQAGFTGNPTPVTYEVSDTAGNTTTAIVTITYAPATVVVVPPVATPVATPAATSKLAATGVNVVGVAGTGLGVVLLGTALILFRRRRQQLG
ncbi:MULTISPECIES: tandem-95 repeat protein [unclassified Cryobacterium]|uniref:Ig-like domain-containing protein n=1 Tax=unclassified Cryobacterium TaxID=2649013 RepID=UPI001068FE9E|nr:MULTISPECIES: tandem-95 repeat protein [unclassified Cryobacterium]TFC54744.1 tandem-95 repeat protein [Cryobacterium sp. TMB3-1-2]TFC71483.1 tandem-95 repeat protein [Cryobacterium sp. TMB3-15]TFC72294.1 tandem-95 repeat protein [Cryobacterium sp. TMB3-10]TFD42470.1 tandem-95 repeat protein [Cryobacterium sp. TMB3-12]